MTIQRYWNAFWKALRITIRGEQVEPSSQAQLMNWSRHTVDLIREVMQAADGEGIDQSARQNIRVHAEGREISMQTILSGIEHHAAVEYPILIRTLAEDGLAAARAYNADDLFRMEKLMAADDVSSAVLRPVLESLYRHLKAVPVDDNDKNL